MIEIDVDLRQLDAIRGQLEATPQEAEKAFTRAVNRITSQIRTRGVRELQKRFGFSNQKALRSRWRLYSRRTGSRGTGRRVFAGAYPAGVRSVATEKQIESQAKRGGTVTFKGRTYTNAFIAVVRDRYRVLERLPDRTVRRLQIDISEDTAEVLRDGWEGVPRLLLTRFESELNFLVNQRLGRN